MLSKYDLDNRLGPLPANPPHLLRPTRIKALRAFMAHGRAIVPNEEIALPWHLCRDLCAINKAEWTNPEDARMRPAES